MRLRGQDVEAAILRVAHSQAPGELLDFARIADILNEQLNEQPGAPMLVRVTAVAMALPAERALAELALVGRCRVCGCTDDNACCVPDARRIIRSCGWMNEEHTLCDNPECLAKAAGISAPVGRDGAGHNGPPAAPQPAA